MTEPMSNYSWPPHFRQGRPSGQPQPPPPPPSSSNPADTTQQHVSVTGNLTASRDNNLNPDGRVSKPIRRRTRASRRTPTTLLSTDTRNFRAMVQQFTGGPSVSLAPFMSSPPQATPPPGSFPATPATMIEAGYYQLLQQNRQPAVDQNYQMFSFAAGNRGGGGEIERDYQIQNQDSVEMGRINLLAGTSGFSMDDLISHHAPHPHPPPSN